MFGFSGLKILIVVRIIATISAAIGGFFLYQKSIVAGLQETIEEQAKEITTLKGNVIKLEISNESLENEITRKFEETKNAYEEISRLREKDIQSVARVNEVEKILRDKNRMERLEAVRNTRKASLLLRLLDREIACQITNFHKVNGKCIRGKWIEEGERLVPIEKDE